MLVHAKRVRLVRISLGVMMLTRLPSLPGITLAAPLPLSRFPVGPNRHPLGKMRFQKGRERVRFCASHAPNSFDSDFTFPPNDTPAALLAQVQIVMAEVQNGIFRTNAILAAFQVVVFLIAVGVI